MVAIRRPTKIHIGTEVELTPSVFCIDNDVTDDTEDSDWNQLLSEYGNRFMITGEVEPDMYYDIISLETEQEYDGVSVDVLKAI